MGRCVEMKRNESERVVVCPLLQFFHGSGARNKKEEKEKGRKENGKEGGKEREKIQQRRAKSTPCATSLGPLLGPTVVQYSTYR
jgi:hypothetical protein